MNPNATAARCSLAGEGPWAMDPIHLCALEAAWPLLASLGSFRTAPARPLARQGTVAVIPIVGPIWRDEGARCTLSGGTALSRIRAQLHAAWGDPTIQAIVFDLDSPGGVAVQDLAHEIRARRGAKPLVAVANGLAASGAYWLACAADEVWATASGDVGGIGVYALHEDISRARERAGIRTSFVSAGKYKTEGNPYEPLGPTARAAIQARVDEVYADFIQDVAIGRKVSGATVRNGFGEGRLVSPAVALRLGMLDGIATLDQVIARLGHRPRSGTPRGLTTAERTRRLAGLDPLPLSPTAIKELGAAIGEIWGHDGQALAEGNDLEVRRVSPRFLLGRGAEGNTPVGMLKDRIIYVDQTLSPREQNLTIAHEVCHALSPFWDEADVEAWATAFVGAPRYGANASGAVYRIS